MPEAPNDRNGQLVEPTRSDSLYPPTPLSQTNIDDHCRCSIGISSGGIEATRSLPTRKLPKSRSTSVALAMDDGTGIRRVEVSTDGGNVWSDAKLDRDLGRYSWRRWRFSWTPKLPGPHRLMACATNASDETQVTEQWNRSGYQRCVIEHVDVTVV